MRLIAALILAAPFAFGADTRHVSDELALTKIQLLDTQRANLQLQMQAMVLQYAQIEAKAKALGEQLTAAKAALNETEHVNLETEAINYETGTIETKREAQARQGEASKERTGQ